MNKIVSLILNFMTNAGVITDDKDQQDFYRYGIEITISSLLNIILILLLGIITFHITESIVFLITFILLRMYMGGFHAGTYFRCNALMCVSFIITACFYELLKTHINVPLTIILLIPFFAAVIAFCPVENVNKPITDKKKKTLKIADILLGLLFSVISIVLISKEIHLGVMMLLTQLLVAIFIVTAKIKERIKERKCYYEKGC